MVDVNHDMFMLELVAAVGLGVWEPVKWHSRWKSLIYKPDNLSSILEHMEKARYIGEHLLPRTPPRRWEINWRIASWTS